MICRMDFDMFFWILKKLPFFEHYVVLERFFAQTELQFGWGVVFGMFFGILIFDLKHLECGFRVVFRIFLRILIFDSY